MNTFEKVLFEALMDVMDKVWHETETEALNAADRDDEVR